MGSSDGQDVGRGGGEGRSEGPARLATSAGVTGGEDNGQTTNSKLLEFSVDTITVGGGRVWKQTNNQSNKQTMLV